MAYFHGIAQPLNNVLKLLFIVGFYGFSVCLNGLMFFTKNLKQIGLNPNDFGMILLKLGIFLVCAFVFSVVLFRLSDGVVKSVLKENYKLQLIQNNFLFAGIQSTIFLMLVLVSSDHFIRLFFSVTF